MIITTLNKDALINHAAENVLTQHRIINTHSTELRVLPVIAAILITLRVFSDVETRNINPYIPIRSRA